jgi:hypothetical protein
MRLRSLILPMLLLVVALPLSASQFIQLPFDQIASESKYIVRGTIEQTWSAWDDSHEVIFTYATIRVSRYFGEATGPDTLVVREVGGTVDGYTQEAIGFPVIRNGDDVVLLLSRWEDGAEYRIHAFNQGKYLVKSHGMMEVLIEDPIKQGHERLGSDRDHGPRPNAFGADDSGLGIDEFARMIDDARADRRADTGKRQ